jgi:DNA-binding NarL/FixJ family response regulator
MPHCKILAVSLSCEGDVARRALSAGADGFICKGDVAGRLPAAIRTVASGATCAPRSDAVPTADGGGPVT